MPSGTSLGVHSPTDPPSKAFPHALPNQAELDMLRSQKTLKKNLNKQKKNNSTFLPLSLPVKILTGAGRSSALLHPPPSPTPLTLVQLTEKALYFASHLIP